MAIISQINFFNYETDLEDYGDLERLLMLLEITQDEELIRALEDKRGLCGRNDYPVEVMWNTFIAGLVFQHQSVASLLRELSRNAQLRWLVSGGQMTSRNIPTASAMSRFEKSLIEFQGLIDDIFINLQHDLSKLLPEFGQRLALDSKIIESHSPRKSSGKRSDRRGEHDAEWGVKEYKGKKEDGSIWSTKKSFFGFKLHLLVDSQYELPLAYVLTTANQADNVIAMDVMEKFGQDTPEFLEPAKFLSADRGYDDQKLVEYLAEKEITAVIDTREKWKEDEKPLLDLDNVTYTEKGKVYCCCPVTAKRRKMRNGGYEKSRDCVRVQCAVKCREGLVCAGAAQCACSKGLRIPRRTDPRAFQRLPRASYKWQREYKKRTSVERVNSRLDVSFGFENHTIRGKRKMQLRCSLALIVMLGVACAHLTHNAKSESYRSLVKRVA
ncbi:MAG: transposase [Clostridiaceae bacterium]|nr:transposase [Clostridiaceae bacterium]